MEEGVGAGTELAVVLEVWVVLVDEGVGSRAERLGAILERSVELELVGSRMWAWCCVEFVVGILFWSSVWYCTEALRTRCRSRVCQEISQGVQGASGRE